jgi:hypothetical protein
MLSVGDFIVRHSQYLGLFIVCVRMVYDGRIVKDLEGNGRGVIKEVSWYFPTVNWGNCVGPVIVTYLAVWIQTGHLLCTGFERYRYSYLLDILFVWWFTSISHINL